MKTSHFRLLNTLARTLLEEDMVDGIIRQNLKKGQACQFFEDIMFSGMDRILCVGLVEADFDSIHWR